MLFILTGHNRVQYAIDNNYTHISGIISEVNDIVSVARYQEKFNEG